MNFRIKVVWQKCICVLFSKALQCVLSEACQCVSVPYFFECCSLFSPSNSNEAVAFVKTEGGWKCKHARKSSKNSTKFQNQ